MELRPCTHTHTHTHVHTHTHCSKKSPVLKRVVPFSQDLLFLLWSVLSKISSEVEHFDISVTELLGRGEEIHRTVGTNV